MSAAFWKLSQNEKKDASAQVSLKFREVSNSFWEGTRREKACLKKLTYLLSQLVSQNKIRTFTSGCIVLSTSFKLCIYK